MPLETADRWPRAATLLVEAPIPERRSVHLLGAHTYATSVTPRSATSTPAAIRGALERYSTYRFDDDVDLLDVLRLVDHGDIADPDTTGTDALTATLQAEAGPWILLGGDNALTWRGLRALSHGDLSEWGLITFDAHLDTRDGVSNGSPVRQLLAEGLPGANVVQVGLADFANSAHYARSAREAGITAMTRSRVTSVGVAQAVTEALAIAGAGGRPVYVDVDVDVCDRSVAPGCPAATPGGWSAEQLLTAVRVAAQDARVRAIDITEIDVARDSADERTIRLAALLVLEAAAGLGGRPQ